MLQKINFCEIMIPDLDELTLLAVSLFSNSLRATLLKINDREEYKEVLEFFGGKTSAYIVLRTELDFSWEEAPDICSNCFTILGSTMGGRVRTGCPYCRSCSEERRWATIFFSTFSGLYPEAATFVLATILAKHYSTRELQ